MRSSRKYLAASLLAVLAAATVSSTSIAAPGQTQSVDGSFRPAKLPKKKRKPIALRVRTATTCPTCASQTPSPATLARLHFDNAGRVYPGVSPKCSVSQVQGDNTEDAKASCPNSIVGAGSATVFVPTTLTTHATYTAEVTAFNGTPQGGRPTLILHNYVQALSFPQDLIGVYYRSTAGRDFRRGVRLDVTVPPLPLGAALTEFITTVGNGFKRGYVKSNCSDRNRRLNVKSLFKFQDGSQLPARDSQRCRVRRA